MAQPTLITFVLVVITLMAGGSLATPTTAMVPSNSSLNWTSCPSPFPPNFQCTKLNAPLHYDQPNGKNITLNIVKIPAKMPSKRIGSLIYQEGGPGVPTAEDTIGYDNRPNWQRLQEQFDVLVLDPRGVGLNYPIKCDPKIWNQYWRSFSYPRTQEQWQQTLDFFGTLGNDCKKRTGEEIWSTFDTMTSARDLETLRVALNEGGINYYGLSWGTQRGQLYAQLYPNNIRTLILDAVEDHTLPADTVAVSTAISFSLAADRFFQWASTNKSSALYGQDANNIFHSLMTQLDNHPVTLTECVQSGKCYPNVTSQDLLSVFGNALDYTTGFPNLARGLAQLARGNFSILAVDVETNDTSAYYSFMIGCNDWYTNETYTQFANRQRAYEALTGTRDYIGAIAPDRWMIICPKWPTEVVNPPKPLNVANTSAPVLLVNAIWDPETPYNGALNVQRQIAGSVLLTRHGEGHGNWFGDALRIMVDYIITGKPPADGTVVYS